VPLINSSAKPTVNSFLLQYYAFIFSSRAKDLFRDIISTITVVSCNLKLVPTCKKTRTQKLRTGGILCVTCHKRILILRPNRMPNCRQRSGRSNFLTPLASLPLHIAVYICLPLFFVYFIFFMYVLFSFDATILVNKDVYTHVQTYHKRLASRIGRAKCTSCLNFYVSHGSTTRFFLRRGKKYYTILYIIYCCFQQ